jgi:acetoin utilization deacetylase AcuC-like enzyme
LVYFVEGFFRISLGRHVDVISIKVCFMDSKPMVVLHDERCADYSSPGHPERPYRVTSTVKRLKEQSKLAIEWRLPKAASADAIRLAHSAAHVKHLQETDQDFDGDTAYHEDIDGHAFRAAGAALNAMELATRRPPDF